MKKSLTQVLAAKEDSTGTGLSGVLRKKIKPLIAQISLYRASTNEYQVSSIKYRASSACIIPMHLTIIFASSHWGQKQALAMFLFLKLLADVIMHIVESKIFAGSKKTTSQSAQESV